MWFKTFRAALGIRIRSAWLLSGLVWLVGFALVQLPAEFARADTPDAQTAALRTKYSALRDQLSHNQFQAPIYLDSNQAANELAGEVYGILDAPFPSVATALAGTTHWCEILLLHLNIKDCRPEASGSVQSLVLYIGSKYDYLGDTASHVHYVYRVAAETPEYVQLVLSAETGPFGTRNYRILAEVIPLGRDQSFMHLSYSYAYGTMARLAMEGYLHTVGRAKVGFTVTGTDTDGKPVLVGGVRGVVERNVVRMYLAVVAYLGAASAPPEGQVEKRLRDWFALTERYPVQLREMDQGEYLDMKRREYRRLFALTP